jgi:putative restriction endonuclease
MNVWIFQSNPNRFDLLANWKDRKIDSWAANQFRNEMKVDDLVYFRVSGRKAGLYAMGTIMSPCYESENEFGNWKVKVRYDTLINPPLLRSETDLHPMLKDYRPLRGQEATNFLVPTNTAEAISQFLSSARFQTSAPRTQSPWTAVTREHIEAALSEWNEIGREQFLERHGVNAAQKFIISYEGHTYDAKAILMRAIRFLPGFEDLQVGAFDGNIDTVAKPLRKLGFIVRDKNLQERRFWWVNQNRTREEFEVGFMWSPFTKKNGDSNPYYEFMSETAPGDRVISFWGGKVQGFGVVTEDPTAAGKPVYREAETWSDLGWMVDVEFETFPSPFSPKDHIAQIRDLLPSKYSPLTSDGKGVELYLTEISESLFTKICRLGKQERSVVIKIASGRTAQQQHSPVLASESLDDEHEEILLQRTDFSGALEKEMVVRARRGQGVFRRNVRAVERSCRVTGIRQIRHLRASHIKPWRVCNDKEKIDGSNGLLLAPHIDHLFDAGWISFSDNGQLLRSSLLSQKVLEAWSIPDHLQVGEFTPEQCVYLEYHRQHVFRS